MSDSKLTLYAVPLSQPARSVSLLLAAANIDHDYQSVNLREKPAEFVARFPAGKVPALSDGDFTLEEAAAILVYLAETRASAKKFGGQNAQERAKINQYLHWNHTNTRTGTRTLVFPALFLGKTPDDLKADIEAFKAGALTALNARLADNKFVAGTDNLSIADLFLLPEIDQFTYLPLPVDVASFEHIGRWLNDVKSALGDVYPANLKAATDLLAQLQAAKAAEAAK
jgi:glutathione S-transferase